MKFSFEFSRRAGRRVEVARRFAAAASGRFQNWVLSFARINADLRSDSVAMIQKSRDLALNSKEVTGYLNTMTRNIVGAAGFRVQCHAFKPDGEPDSLANRYLETCWKKYQRKLGGFVTLDRVQGGRDFDISILHAMLRDGEAFIRRVVDPSSPFLYRHELLDALDVDHLYNVATGPDGCRIAMGIKLDAGNRPLSYFVRKADNDFYQNGERVEVPAEEIIHIFRKFFPGQVRGYTPLAATILSLNQVDSYVEAELVAARMQACNMAFYEDNGNADEDPADTDDQGEYLTEMNPGQISAAPRGKTVKQLSNNHPSGNFGSFIKAVLRGVANSLGISYNKNNADYESVNYSSLREAALEDRAAWRELQEFLIENWKELQYNDFLKGILLSGLIPGYRFTAFDRLFPHTFFGRTWDWVDPVKDLTALKMKLELMLTDPMTEIEQMGKDPDDVLARWAQWVERCKKFGIDYAKAVAVTPELVAALTNTQEEKEV